MNQTAPRDGISRRTFITAATALAATAAVRPATGATPQGTILLPPLPFAEDALEPTISARTLGFHYGKHHQGYVTTLNTLIAGTRFEKMSLIDIIRATEEDDDSPLHEKIFNNAAQVWNHTFYWNSLAPAGKGGEPSLPLLAAINKAFGSFDGCKKALADAAVAQFGSGWAWLVQKKGRLLIKKTENAETPIEEAGEGIPLLTIDVWEHAYYLDWQNRRADYANAITEKHLNWAFASANFA